MKIIVCPHCGMEVEIGGPVHVDRSQLYKTMDSSLEHICTSVRAFRGLWRMNINTMADLHDYIQKNGKEGLLRIYGISNVTCKVICDFYDDFMERHAEYMREERL